jgi:ribosomal protein L7/L12
MDKDQRIAYLEEHLRDCAVQIARGSASKLTAIRAWRAATGAMLKDAKDYVESLEQREKEVGKTRLEDRVYHIEQRLMKLEAADASPRPR